MGEKKSIPSGKQEMRFEPAMDEDFVHYFGLRKNGEPFGPLVIKRSMGKSRVNRG